MYNPVVMSHAFSSFYVECLLHFTFCIMLLLQMLPTVNFKHSKYISEIYTNTFAFFFFFGNSNELSVIFSKITSHCTLKY